MTDRQKNLVIGVLLALLAYAVVFRPTSQTTTVVAPAYAPPFNAGEGKSLSQTYLDNVEREDRRNERTEQFWRSTREAFEYKPVVGPNLGEIFQKLEAERQLKEAHESACLSRPGNTFQFRWC